MKGGTLHAVLHKTDACISQLASRLKCSAASAAGAGCSSLCSYVCQRSVTAPSLFPSNLYLKDDISLQLHFVLLVS